MTPVCIVTSGMIKIAFQINVEMMDGLKYVLGQMSIHWKDTTRSLSDSLQKNEIQMEYRVKLR